MFYMRKFDVRVEKYIVFNDEISISYIILDWMVIYFLFEFLTKIMPNNSSLILTMSFYYFILVY